MPTDKYEARSFLDDEQRRKLKELAEATGLSISKVIATAVEEMHARVLDPGTRTE